MDCDQVFNVLTRGPFPTGAASDDAVEAHLERCGECWRLAEALKPALELFQESVPPAESRDLPGYWGDARPAATVVADLLASEQQTIVARAARRVAGAHYLLPRAAQPRPLAADMLTIVGFLTCLAAGAAGLVMLVKAI